MGARITGRLVEVITPRTTYDPTTPTGAGATQAVVEVLFLTSAGVRATLDVIEVLLSDTTVGSGGGGGSTGGGVRVFGYAG